MHITSTFARKSPCHLLRESYWQDGKVKKRTLANLSALPQPLIDILRLALANCLPVGSDGSALSLRSCRLLGTAQRLQLDRLLFHKPDRRRSLALAMIACRLLKPGSKLRVERELGPSGRSTLAALLDIPNASADDLYEAMDWLAKRQPAIERQLAAHGYSRDHRSDRPQIVYGLLCNCDGCPVAVQAFAGNTSDPDTIAD